MESYKKYKRLQELADDICHNLYWELLSFTNQNEDAILYQGDLVTFDDVFSIRELPKLLQENTFIENNKIGLVKKYQISPWRSKELLFEFETPLTMMLSLFEAMANAETEDEMKQLVDELMIQQLAVTSETVE